jgi:hypothetical protein
LLLAPANFAAGERAGEQNERTPMTCTLWTPGPLDELFAGNREILLLEPAAWERASVSGGQAEHIPDFFPDCTPARERDMSAFVDEQRGINGPED